MKLVDLTAILLVLLVTGAARSACAVLPDDAEKENVTTSVEDREQDEVTGDPETMTQSLDVRPPPMHNFRASVMPDEHNVIVDYLARLEDKLERVEGRISRMDADLSNRMRRMNEDHATAAEVNRPPPRQQQQHAWRGSGGDGDAHQAQAQAAAVSTSAYDSLHQLLTVLQSKMDRIESRVELHSTQLASKVDQRTDETQTLIAEMLDMATKPFGKPDNDHGKASNDDSSAPPPPPPPAPVLAVNYRELAQELGKEMTAMFARWTTNVVEEITKAYQRVSNPGHMKVTSELNFLHDKIIEALVAVGEVRQIGSRLEETFTETSGEAAKRHEVTSEKLTRLRDDMYQQASAADRNFDSMKIFVSQHLQDVETELRHQGEAAKEMEYRVYTKLSQSLENMLQMSDSCITTTHNMTRQHIQYQRQQQHQQQQQQQQQQQSRAQEAYAHDPSASAYHPAVLLPPLFQAVPYLPQPSSANVHQQYNTNGHRQHQTGQERTTPTFRGAYRQPATPNDDARMTTAGTPSPSHISGPRSVTDAASVDSEDSTEYPDLDTTARRQMESLHSKTDSIKDELARVSDRLSVFEKIKDRFMSKLTNMYSELFNGITKLSGQLRDIQGSFDAQTADVSQKIGKVVEIGNRGFSSGGTTTLAEVEKMIKKKLKDLGKGLQDSIFALRVDLHVLEKRTKNAEIREHHLTETLESAIELLQNIVKNNATQCRAGQAEMKFLLTKHNEAVGAAVDNATTAVYDQTKRVLDKMQNIDTFLRLVYTALVDIDRKLPNSTATATARSSTDAEDRQEQQQRSPITIATLVTGFDDAQVAVTTPTPTTTTKTTTAPPPEEEEAEEEEDSISSEDEV